MEHMSASDSQFCRAQSSIERTASGRCEVFPSMPIVWSSSIRKFSWRGILSTRTPKILTFLKVRKYSGPIWPE
ncbi:hypothetical protein DPMN_141198 [Dreissena polymorpha]|uniref:Uncharacterized protein n=1 Tax=Dreissena polymorpha TaxID=45954 RepID=A0A9D4GBW6_DREPO|nr:hypothetical protein DPMN_141198 [Dreissena polymorpha]